jgi:hypothetical protein
MLRRITLVLACFFTSLLATACGDGGPRTTTSRRSSAQGDDAAGSASAAAPLANWVRNQHAVAAATRSHPSSSETPEARSAIRAGESTCKPLSNARARSRFLASARTAEAHHHIGARIRLLTQLGHLPGLTLGDPNVRLMVAGLYAVAQSPPLRTAAFQGCAVALARGAR